MKTKILENSDENIEEAAKVIKAGGLVVFPTETVYGLGADAFNEKAVDDIYKAKGRPSDNPMIVHISRASDIGQLTPMLSPLMVELIDNFWPGPLTLVMEKKKKVPDITTGGLDTVAVRMPDNETARMLISMSGCPIAAPSANLSGKPSPTAWEHAAEDLDGKVDIILKGDNCRVGIESTVLDVTGKIPIILRPGLVTAEDIKAVTGGKVELDPALKEGKPADETAVPRAPGMKYRHYAPKADMVIIEGQRDKVKNEIERLKGLNEKLGLKVGVILFEEKAFIEAAHDFFARLRQMDSEGKDLILAGALSDTDGVGFAVMNRMLKSAGYNIVRV